jgi:hypothetical protein
MLLGNSNVSQDVKPLYHVSTRTSGGRLEKWDLSLERALKADQNDDRHIFTALRNKVVVTPWSKYFVFSVFIWSGQGVTWVYFVVFRIGVL